jgi:hypothetical protein
MIVQMVMGYHSLQCRNPIQGMTWFIGKDDVGIYFEHAGGGPGINSLLRFYPKKNIAVSVMANFNEYAPDVIINAAVKLAWKKKLQ